MTNWPNNLKEKINLPAESAVDSKTGPMGFGTAWYQPEKNENRGKGDQREKKHHSRKYYVRWPVQPAGQLHLKLLIPSVHEPPFMHGEEAHSFTFTCPGKNNLNIKTVIFTNQ